MTKDCSSCKHYYPLTKEERDAFMGLFDGHCRADGQLVCEDDVCEKYIEKEV